MGKRFELRGRKEFYKPRGLLCCGSGSKHGLVPEAYRKFSLASRGHYGEAGWVLNWNPFDSWEINLDIKPAVGGMGPRL